FDDGTGKMLDALPAGAAEYDLATVATSDGFAVAVLTDGQLYCLHAGHDGTTLANLAAARRFVVLARLVDVLELRASDPLRRKAMKATVPDQIAATEIADWFTRSLLSAALRICGHADHAAELEQLEPSDPGSWRDVAERIEPLWGLGTSIGNRADVWELWD